MAIPKTVCPPPMPSSGARRLISRGVFQKIVLKFVTGKDVGSWKPVVVSDESAAVIRSTSITTSARG